MDKGNGMSYLQSKSQLNQDFPFKIFRYSSQLLKQPMHIHDYVQIAYVLNGVCNHQLRGKSLTVSRGDVFLIAPGLEHSFRAIEDKAFELVLIDFLPFLISEQLKPFSGTLGPLLYPSEDNVESAAVPQPWLHIGKNKQILFEHLLQDMQDEFEHRELGYQYAIRITLAKLLILFDRECRKAKRKPAKQPTLVEQQPIDEVKRYINDNYSQDIPLEHGAFLANMAPAYFSHVFKKETGQTFIDFVNEVRIERAMELIRRDAHTITQIGFQVGFHHLSHFIRTFKKRTGITPTEYKKTFRNFL
ncbi:helix-turn-helix domain-containing protein [Paenibacillus sp. HWE-109]|uniref:AraC family transcriptional regulator n=1 Tax=Paenibacillus sp. HWE-109 TaxID=1306526 RepID=UPI001EDE496C|nr:AraC family transcriptional regulator [Paenibacillus sp. HWE-109]UKS30959.1 helix-turn-helix domain-containing protein [Paenibacillus sp. HWE-109]